MCTRLELEDVTTYEASEITVKHGDAQINVNIALIFRASLELFHISDFPALRDLFDIL